MGKLVVVKGDPVTGKDKHLVAGSLPSPPGGPYAGTGEYQYNGSITGQLSAFVTIDGTAVALVSSVSSLDSGEAAPTGAHGGPQGANFAPEGPDKKTLNITDQPVGKGVPNSAAGSGLLTVDGVKVLLHDDKIDTCGPAPTPAASKVTAAGQDFVTCSQ